MKHSILEYIDLDKGRIMDNKQPLRVGVGGPVGSGKTALLDVLCKSMREWKCICKWVCIEMR